MLRMTEDSYLMTLLNLRVISKISDTLFQFVTCGLP